MLQFDRGRNMFIAVTGTFCELEADERKGGRDAPFLIIPASPTQELASCSIAVQQMIAIARAVDMDCKILILDEPTSSLDEDEVQKLFASCAN